MFAISFDLKISELKKAYGENYTSAYDEIRQVMQDNNFYWQQGSLYLTKENDLSIVFNTILQLSKIDWMRKSVRDIQAFKVEDWSSMNRFFK